jgi:hypothetical protein
MFIMCRKCDFGICHLCRERNSPDREKIFFPQIYFPGSGGDAGWRRADSQEELMEFYNCLVRSEWFAKFESPE